MLHTPSTFTVLADWQIRNPEIYHARIWTPARQKLISRLSWLDALTLIYRFEGRVFWPSGRRFEMPDVDDIFTDSQNRWMSHFLEADATGRAPKRHCRIIPRLRLIGLYCDITAEPLEPGAPEQGQVSRPSPGPQALRP